MIKEIQAAIDASIKEYERYVVEGQDPSISPLRGVDVEELFEDIRTEGADDGYSDGYSEGFDAGWEEGKLEAEDECPEWSIEFREELTRKGFDLLNSIEVYWDAALKALIFTQKGREVSFR